MKMRQLFKFSGIALLASSSMFVGGNVDEVMASTFHYNTPTIWKIQSPTTTDYVKIRNDGNGVCFEGLHMSDSSTEASRVSGGTKNYKNPVTLANYEKVKVDGLSLSLVLRNATGTTGASGYLGDYLGFFFSTTIMPYSSRTSAMPYFTLFAQPYVGSAQARYVMSTGGNYASFNNASIQYVAPDTSSSHNSPAGSIVMNHSSYTIEENTYYSVGLNITFKSYNEGWWQLQLKNYSTDTGYMWTNNAGWDKETETATYFLEKSYTNNFIDSEGKTYLHVFGCGVSTFGYIYDLSEDNTVVPYSAQGGVSTPSTEVNVTPSEGNNVGRDIAIISIPVLSALLLGILGYVGEAKVRKSNG